MAHDKLVQQKREEARARKAEERRERQREEEEKRQGYKNLVDLRIAELERTIGEREKEIAARDRRSRSRERRGLSALPPLAQAEREIKEAKADLKKLRFTPESARDLVEGADQVTGDFVGFFADAEFPDRPPVGTYEGFGPTAESQAATGYLARRSQMADLPTWWSRVETGDPLTDSIVSSATTGQTPAGMPAPDPLSIILGDQLDPNAPVFVAPGQRTFKDRVKDFIPAAVDQTKNVGELMQDFYLLEGDELRDLQYDLFIGGFYGEVDPHDIAWGVPGDDFTRNAWQQAVVRSARFYAANKKLSVDDVLKLAAQTAGKAGGGQKTLVQLTDPASLADTIDEAAKKVLGRKASAEEKRLFTAAMHESERKRDMTAAAYSNPGDVNTRQAAASLRDGLSVPGKSGDSVTELTGVSPEARAEEFAREIDPQAADSRKVISYIDHLKQMMEGVV